MRLLFSCIAGLILGWSPVVFADANTVQKEPTLNENYFGVTILADRAWIVGYYGTILHSRDRGLTWELQPSPSRSALYRVRFVTPDRGWISGSYGTLMQTKDGGKNWAVVPSGTAEHLFDISWPDHRFGEDYGIYIVSRAIEEHHWQGRTDLDRALIDGVSTAGKAVLYTAFLISASILFWAFSPLRFQAEMGWQLLTILSMNMLGGLFLLPAIISLLKPKFVSGPARA